MLRTYFCGSWILPENIHHSVMKLEHGKMRKKRDTLSNLSFDEFWFLRENVVSNKIYERKMLKFLHSYFLEVSIIKVFEKFYRQNLSPL